MDKKARIDMLVGMLEKEPSDIFLNYSLSLEYFSIQEFAKAESGLQKVMDLQKDYIPAFYQMGKLKEALGMNEEALHYYRKGLELARVQKNNKAINEFGEAIFMLDD